jgi:hypothetical protein
MFDNSLKIIQLTLLIPEYNNINKIVMILSFIYLNKNTSVRYLKAPLNRHAMKIPGTPFK